jgi:streptogramin lyase
MTRLTRNLTARARRRLADRVRTRPRLEGLEDRCLLSPTITELPLPTGSSDPWENTTGPDGNIWYTDPSADSIGMVNPTTHAVSEFPIPTATAGPRWITAGPDGNLWFTEWGGNKIGMINPTTHAISEFPVPTASSGLYGITAGPDGNLWFAEYNGNKIGRINPATHLITEFATPTAGSAPREITTGPDGNLWFTESRANQIGMINPTTGAIAEFPVPTPNSLPRSIAAGPDGNLWFTEGTGGHVGMINPMTHSISEFTVHAGSGPSEITAGPDGNLWFTEFQAQSIGEINPTTDVVAEYPIPNSPFPDPITAGPDGNLWFGSEQSSSGGYSIDVAAVNQTPITQLVITQQPPASLTAGSGFGLTVQAEDSSGNLITSFNGTVTVGLASNPGGTTLGGTVTAASSGGVATFSGLTLTTAASGYTIYVSGGGPIPTTTSPIAVSPAAAAQLVITQQPPSRVQVNTPFSMQASIEDAYGNVVTTASGTVNVAFANNPTRATLGGTLSVTASAGVASFTNLTVNKVGSGYTLRVSSSGLTSATSNPIDVTKNGKSPSTLVASATSQATDVSLAPLVLDGEDLWGGLRFKKRPRSS